MSINAARSLDKISYAALEQKIQELQNTDFATRSTEDVNHMIASIIDQCPLQKRELALSGIYRARKNGASQLFTNAKELWAPPPSVITKASRLNDIGQSRLYAADTSETALLEVRPLVGDTITLLIARTREEGYASLKNVIFIGIERSLSDTLLHLTDDDILRRSTYFRNLLGEDNYKKWLLVYNYLSAILGKAIAESEEHMYKPTISLANLLFSNPNLDAITYPSVATEAHGINICMIPEKADAYFKPSEAWMIKIEAEGLHPTTNERLPGIEFLRRSNQINSDNSIDWLPEGAGLTQEAINRFVGSARVSALPSFPKPYVKESSSNPGITI